MLQTVSDLDLREDTHLSHALWAVLEKIGAKQKQHKNLEQGASHQVNLRVAGDIDGKRFSESISSVVSIGHDHEKTTSVTPQVPQLVAFILSKLNQATRDHILKSVPLEFTENANRIPEVDEVIVAQSRDLLGKLRAAKQITARGAVRCQFAIQG